MVDLDQGLTPAIDARTPVPLEKCKPFDCGERLSGGRLAALVSSSTDVRVGFRRVLLAPLLQVVAVLLWVFEVPQTAPFALTSPALFFWFSGLSFQVVLMALLLVPEIPLMIGGTDRTRVQRVKFTSLLASLCSDLILVPLVPGAMDFTSALFIFRVAF